MLWPMACPATHQSCLVIVYGFHDSRVAAGDGQGPLLVLLLLRSAVLPDLLDDGLGGGALEDGARDRARAAHPARRKALLG